MDKNKRNNIFFKIIVFALAGIIIGIKILPHYPAIKKYIDYRAEEKVRKEKYENEKKIRKTEYYDDGILKKESFEGVTKYYRENGVLECVIGNGRNEDYDETGTLIKENEKKPEIKDGEYKGYSPEGKLILDYNYKNGKFHGVQKVYFNNSDKLYSKKEYKDGEPVGIHIVYYENGHKKNVTDYNFGKNKILRLEYTWPNENLSKKEIFLCPTKDNWILESKEEYNSSGQLISKITNKGNLKEKEKRLYYNNGNLRSVVFYRNDEKLDIGKECYENGNIKINHYYDEKSGNLVAEEYYEDGKFLAKTIYMGKTMYDEIKYYIENRSDNTKYYEFQRDGKKKIERFFDRSGNVVYENIEEK